MFTDSSKKLIAQKPYWRKLHTTLKLFDHVKVLLCLLMDANHSGFDYFAYLKATRDTWHFGAVKRTSGRILPFFRKHNLLICAILDICTVLHEECDILALLNHPQQTPLFWSKKLKNPLPWFQADFWRLLVLDSFLSSHMSDCILIYSTLDFESNIQSRVDF